MSDRPEPPPALPHPTTDAHTHLGTTRRKTGWSPAEQVAAAAEVGVVRLVDVGYDVASSREVAAHAEEFDQVIAAVAIHPHDVAELGAGLDEALREL